MKVVKIQATKVWYPDFFPGGGQALKKKKIKKTVSYISHDALLPHAHSLEHMQAVLFFLLNHVQTIQFFSNKDIN